MCGMTRGEGGWDSCVIELLPRCLMFGLSGQTGPSSPSWFPAGDSSLDYNTINWSNSNQNLCSLGLTFPSLFPQSSAAPSLLNWVSLSIHIKLRGERPHHTDSRMSQVTLQVTLQADSLLLLLIYYEKIFSKAIRLEKKYFELFKSFTSSLTNRTLK